MKKTVSILLLILLMALSGCKSSERLTDLTVVQALGIDYQSGEYTVTVQYLNLNSGSDKKESLGGCIIAVASWRAPDIERALAGVEKLLPDRLFFGQSKLLAVSRSALRQREALLGFLKSSGKVRPDVLLTACSDAGKVIRCRELGASVPADSIVKKLQDACKQPLTVCDFLGGETALPFTEVKDDCCRIRRS